MVRFYHQATYERRSCPLSRRSLTFSLTPSTSQVAALQLIDRGILTLGIPASRYIPELSTPLQLLDSIDPSTGEPKFTTTNEEITVLSLMNQTSGFGSEPGELVSGWKAWSKVGTGFVNSCKRVSRFIGTDLGIATRG